MYKKPLLAGLSALLSLTVLSAISGCATEPVATEASAKKYMTREERFLSLAPQGALRPASDPWGGVVTRPAQGALMSVALHEDNVLAIWHIAPDRTVREVGQAEVGYHPDAVAALAPDIVAVAVEGAGKVNFWRIGDTQPPTKLGEISTPFPSREIVAHDLDSDGKQDLILAPYRGKEVAILWGEGELRFSAPQKLEAALIPWHPRVTDWDQDGRPDLIWSDWDTGSARVYLNQGKRAFKLSMLQAPQSGSPRQLGVGDVDGDGRPDAVMAMSTGKAARILFNRGASGIVVEDVPAPAWGYVAAEVMKDGTLVLAEEQRIILARKVGGAWAFRLLPAGSLPTPILLNDLDGDGHEDLVVFHSARGGTTITYGPLWEAAAPFVMPGTTNSK